MSRRAGSLDGRSLIVVRPSSRQCEVGPSLGLTLTPPLSSCARLLGVTSPHCEPESSHSPSGDPALTPDCRCCLPSRRACTCASWARTLCLWRDPEGLSVLLSVLSLLFLSRLSPLPLSFSSGRTLRHGLQMRGDAGRYGEMRGDAGRCGEILRF